MNGDHRSPAEAIAEPAFDIDRMVVRLPDGHLPIDPNVHLDGDRGPDAARAEVVGLLDGRIGGDDAQDLLLGLGGKRLFEQLAETRTDQVEDDLEDEDGDDERRNRVGAGHTVKLPASFVGR